MAMHKATNPSQSTKQNTCIDSISQRVQLAVALVVVDVSVDALLDVIQQGDGLL